MIPATIVVLDYLLPGAILAAAVLGHFGLWIWLYNRINATGFRRKTIKRTEMAIVLACGLIPLGLLLIELRIHGTTGLFEAGNFWDKLSLLTKSYSIIAILFAIAVAPFWILDRPQFATS